MNFSAEKAARKWPCGRTKALIVTVAVLAAACATSRSAEAAQKPIPFPFSGLFGDGRPSGRSRLRGAIPPALVPLPRPRPAGAPGIEPEQPVAEKPPSIAPLGAPVASPADKPAAQAATPGPAVPGPAVPGPQPPSACRLALTEEIAIAPSIPDIHGPGGCGGEDLVRLEAVVLPDKRQVALKPAATLRCAMASQVADWVRTDIAPLTIRLGSVISALDNFDSFECRGRNRVVGAPLSEHGRANALDVRGFRQANGESISLTDRSVPREIRETVLHSVCARFTTVLGPGSDGYHEDHIHLDLMQRHNNYKICQWNVWDAMPRIAPLMPAERPEEAPPRDVAAKSDSAKPDPDAEDAPPAYAARPDADAKPGAAGPDGTVRSAKKKRRQTGAF